MFGGTVSRITIKRGAVGKTNWKSSDAAAFVARLAGYLGPSVFGLAGALLLVRGQVTACCGSAWCCCSLPSCRRRPGSPGCSIVAHRRA